MKFRKAILAAAVAAVASAPVASQAVAADRAAAPVADANEMGGSATAIGILFLVAILAVFAVSDDDEPASP